MLNVDSAKKDEIEVYKDKKGEFRWRRKSTNGQIVGSSSEGYSTKENCLNNIKRQFIECGIKQD
jgi:uncharacterized protein YegP (UPF0339 family)